MGAGGATEGATGKATGEGLETMVVGADPSCEIFFKSS